MTSLPAGYQVRPGTCDVDDVVALEDAYEIDLYGRPYPHISTWVREGWTRPRFHPARDSWMVISPEGQLAGYAQVYDEEPHTVVEAVVRVHPQHRGRGIGGALVGLAETRAREHLPLSRSGTVRLLQDITSVDSAAHELLEARGYTLDRHFWHMYLNPDVTPPTTRTPVGVEIRPFDRSIHARVVHEVLEEAFRHHYLYSPTPFDEWEKETLDAPAFDAGLWLVAVEGDRVVGALVGRTMVDDGWVSDLGVLESARGRGIGAALLIRSFETFGERGFATVALNVDAANETGATALYERVGMKMRRQWDLYLKVLADDRARRPG
jgi:mycothiol synthase